MLDDPPAPVLTWAAQAIAPDARARVVRRLTGGEHADTHLLRIERGATHEFAVLRRYPTGDTAAQREVNVLTALDGLRGLAPKLLAADPDGAHTGHPTVLLTQLPGSADITPADPSSWARQLGQALARVHATPVTGFRGVLSPDPPQAPTELRRAWPRLYAAPRVLTHFDYWSGNVVWEDGVLTGVVDWSGAAFAPRGFDLAWCRLDLALLADLSLADELLRGYERAAGLRVPDLALWDLHAGVRSAREVETWLPNYHGLGRTDLTAADLRARHTDWHTAALARVAD